MLTFLLKHIIFSFIDVIFPLIFILENKITTLSLWSFFLIIFKCYYFVIKLKTSDMLWK